MAKTASNKTAKGSAVAKAQPALESGKSLVLVQDQMPEHIKQGVNRGSENVGTDDLVIPRLEIVQALSPAVKKGDPGYIKGAELGDLTNSVTRRNYGSEVYLLPVHYTKQYLVWKDRQHGGGFFGAYPTPEEAKRRADEEGGEKNHVAVIDTPTHLCLIIDKEAGTVDEIMVPMPRTKSKISRQWNSMIKLAGGDRFSRIYKVTSQAEKNAKGDFHNFAVQHVGFPSKGLYAKAEALYEQVKGGMRGRVMDVEGFDNGGTSDTDDDGDM